jgi:hypothetical protein
MTIRTISRSSHIPDVKTLKQEKGFRQILELDFTEMIPFVLTQIRRKSLVSLFYLGINMGLLGFIIVYAVAGLMGNHLSWWMIFKQSAAGILAGSILVIPIHELLHGLSYRILGARNIQFGTDLRQMIFYVTADRYPVSGRELYFLAMMPFLIINLLTLFITFRWFPHTLLFPSLFLLSHNVMCIGDFAIVNYVFKSRKRMYTFDETENKKSYFFEAVTQQSE